MMLGVWSISDLVSGPRRGACPFSLMEVHNIGLAAFEEGTSRKSQASVRPRGQLRSTRAPSVRFVLTPIESLSLPTRRAD
jgi:hypothetical protein